MIRYGAWQLGFFSPGHRPSRSDVFGCATIGAVTGRQYHAALNIGMYTWGTPVRGCVFSGTFAEVLSGVANCAFRPSFMLVFYAHMNGAGAFVKELAQAMPGVPFSGGMAASADGTCGELAPAAEDVAVLMCETDVFSVNSKNVLEARGGIYEFDAETPHVIRRLREPDMPWEDAADVVALLKARYRIAADDFEAFTFSDNDGLNLNLGSDDGGGAIRIGTDLPETGFLHPRTSDRETAAVAMVAYAQARSSLIIASVAQGRLVGKPFSVPESSTMVFLSGQIVSGRCADLMLTALRRH